MPDDLLPDENVVGMISPAIKLTLQRIAQFTETVRRQKLYLSKLTTYDELLDYHASNRKSNQRIYDVTALEQGRTPSGGNHNVPAFSVPKLVGNRIEGHAFVDNVMRKFKGRGQLSYLEYNLYYDNHPAWSESFSSRLLDSLADNDILGYILTELKDEGNCEEVW